MGSQRKRSSAAYARRIIAQVLRHPSNRRQPAASAPRAVRWQIRKRIRRSPVDVQFWGLVLRCYPNSQSASNVWYFTPRYDHDEMLFIERLLGPGDGVLDVGANVGTYTLLAAALTAPDGQVTSFEADPVNAARLRENVSRNALTRRVTVHEAAVSSSSGKVEFFADRDVSNSIRRETHRAGRSREVDSVRLDDVAIRPERLVLAKVDIEGAEVDALRGAATLLAGARPFVWMVEVLEHQLARFGATWSDLTELMDSFGYHPFRYDADRHDLHPVDRAPRGNCLFVADRSEVEVRRRLEHGWTRVSPDPPRVRIDRTRK